MSASFKFAHLSDTHVRPDAAGDSQVFVDHLAQIATGDYAFAIHTGDLMEEPSAWAARAFRTLASMLRIPVYVVPGNHDVYNPHLGDVEAPWWARLSVDSELEAQYRNWYGPAWYAFTHQGVSFVALDSLIINSGLPEEGQQWEWLEDMLAELAACRPEHLILFTHLPLFIQHPCEHLDPTDFRNRYLVIAPPGRDRLLRLVRRHHVSAVLSGHLHAPWETSHAWPEGFTTSFVTTGSSGPTSPMAIDQFNLPLTPLQGLGFHEHRVGKGGLSSSYRPHGSSVVDGQWRLGQAWTTCCPEGQEPAPQDGLDWCRAGYHSPAPEWRVSDPSSRIPLGGHGGMACFVRQAFEAEADAAALFLELSTERAVEIYLNGALLYTLAPLGQRPPAWQSAGGTYNIDGPRLSLGLDQQLVRKGENVLALRVNGQEPGGDYIAFRELEPCACPGRGLKDRD